MIKIKRYKPRHMKQGRNGISLRQLALCGCVFMVLETVSTGITLSKMRSASTGDDSARVAVFAVEAQAKEEQNTLSIDCDESGSPSATYSFIVSNQEKGKTAEVALQYKVIVELPESLPEGLSLLIDGVQPTASNDGKYTFSYDDWRFFAGKFEEKPHTLTITADPEKVEKNIHLNDIKVSVLAEQVD